jgi:predicted ester cyclase
MNRTSWILFSFLSGTSTAFGISCGNESRSAAAVPSAEEAALPQARTTVIGETLPQSQRDSLVLAARRFYGFWDTGDKRLLDSAIAPSFTDRTLPPGRPQGPEGPAFASRNFRQAVPDLRCEIEQLIVAQNRVIAHLRFTGHFSGTFANKKGQGEAINFIATDILQIVDGHVTDNWHIEDNLTLFQQLGLVESGH